MIGIRAIKRVNIYEALRRRQFISFILLFIYGQF